MKINIKKVSQSLLAASLLFISISGLKAQTSVNYTVDLYYDTNNNMVHDPGETYLNNAYNIAPVRGQSTCSSTYGTGTFYGNCPGALFGGYVPSCNANNFDVVVYDFENILQPGITVTSHAVMGSTYSITNLPLKSSAASEIFVSNISTQFRNTNLPSPTLFTAARAGGIVDTAAGTLCSNSTIDIIQPYKFNLWNHASCGAVQANFNFKMDGVSIATYSFVGSSSVNVYTTAALSTGTLSVSSNTLIPYMPQFSYSVTNYPAMSPGYHSFEIDITPVGMTQTNTSVMKSVFYVNDCGQMNGNAFVDCNLNCTKDPSEFYPGSILNLYLTNATNTVYVAPNAAGNYTANVPIGTYTITPSVYGTYSICGTPTTVLTVTTGSTYTLNLGLRETFAIPTDFYSYLFLSNGIPGPGAVPGGSLTINAYNYRFGTACSAIPNPTQFKVVLPPLMSYVGTVSTTPAPSSIITATTGDTIVWNSPLPNDLHQFTVKTATSAVIGNSYCVTSIVYPLADANSADNAYTRCWNYGGPFDPNEKISETPGMAANGDIAPGTPDLTYTIRFQNLGTGKAVNVTIKDTIDANLDINSLQVLSSSYPVLTQVNAGTNLVEFKFADINLPAAVTDEPGSHGYVRFKLNLKPSLPVGTVINNRGHIYFDYNNAVATNKTINTIAVPLGINEVKIIHAVNLYPNPTKGLLTINATENLRSVQVYNVTGELMMNVINLNSKTTTLDLQSFAKGLYFVKTETKEKIVTKKIVLE
jgi:uncharacterized repeat protein (TIGR01451 family)